MLNAIANLLNMQVVMSTTVYLIIYRMHHQWRLLYMHVRNVIVDTGTLTEGLNIYLSKALYYFKGETSI